ncbi:E3 ubiquitin-protein ligase TRIM39 isoform X1 [Brienomyrus brachyistius]|uniref:E3 ubiquitin-protein ligase TRIM39 isoform X1 n=1 Tax=Brienomyrus brachyistius TaxID=42636 RepID=UPI0020B2889F|nr:E3 ubiquitin-protein ligase TRIM39 isoform X1 [Brienomyrus brachyistius]XP_048826806.1 E3 ubiquitin-protein ligase TRIM39 isoform X1 [Brienomyrus brachyistius]
MASSSSLLSEEQCHCSICLDVFTNPVSLPCGHNFCMTCIRSYWQTSAIYQCPMCKKTFYKQPDISINTVLKEIAEQFKDMRASASGARQSEEPSEQVGQSGEVSCDVCTGEKMKAVKSCLVCLTSYCDEHIRTHNGRFTKHKLVEPVKNLEDRMCKKHERLLELFCKRDQTCVCVLCTETNHRAHYTVPVEREWTEKRAQLKKTEVEVQQMIHERLKKMDEIQQSVELSKCSAQTEIEECVQVFTNLIRVIQQTQAELIGMMEEKQKATERRAEGLIKDLEIEIAELQTRNTELKRLSQTDDHIHFLQSFPLLCTPPHTKNWSDVTVYTDLPAGTIRRALSRLGETLSEEMEKLADTELKKIQKYTADVTFNPKTANPWLLLSDDGKQLKHGGTWQDLPNEQERFDTVVIVLGTEGLTSGRHYWEVQVGEKDDWYLGVARASVKRKGRIAVSIAHGYWALAMKKNQEYRVSSTPPIVLTLDSKPRKVGVYVDYEEGQISFYNVKARSHIYTFMDVFTEKLFPFFYLYCCDKASDTMVICSGK